MVSRGLEAYPVDVTAYLTLWELSNVILCNAAFGLEFRKDLRFLQRVEFLHESNLREE